TRPTTNRCGSKLSPCSDASITARGFRHSCNSRSRRRATGWRRKRCKSSRVSVPATAVRRTDLPDEVLTTALRSLGQEYATAQDAALLRELYPTLKTDRSREAVFSALAEMGGSENPKWLV